MLKMLLWLPLILGACQPIPDRRQENSTVPVRRSLPHEQVQQLIFFGVLEGLYRDGVETRVASAIASARSCFSPPEKRCPRDPTTVS